MDGEVVYGDDADGDGGGKEEGCCEEGRVEGCLVRGRGDGGGVEWVCVGVGGCWGSFEVR